MKELILWKEVDVTHIPDPVKLGYEYKGNHVWLKRVVIPIDDVIKDLQFIWSSVNELQQYLHRQIEGGAKGSNKDYDNASKAKKFIKAMQERLIQQ